MYHDYQLNLALFFTSMILHFGSVFTIRNGIQLLRYVIYHGEEFSHPISAFTLGLLVVLVNMYCEITNLL